MKKMLSIVLGAVVVVAIAVGAYVLGGNASKQNSEHSSKNTTSAKTDKKQVKTSVEKSSKSESSEKTSETSSTSVTQESSSSQVDQNQLQETEFDNGLLNDDMAMKAVVYYSVMTGANQNDKMWAAFKDMI